MVTLCPRNRRAIEKRAASFELSFKPLEHTSIRSYTSFSISQIDAQTITLLLKLTTKNDINK